MLIALLFLLLCAMAGIAVLVAATTASGRSSRLKENESTYYTVSSAARLLQQGIKGETYTRYQLSNDSGAVVESGYYRTPESFLGEFLKEGADHIYDSGSAYEDVWELSLRGGGMETVQAHVRMDVNYQLYIEIELDRVTYIIEAASAVSTNRENVSLDDEILAEGGTILTRETTSVAWTDVTVQSR